jgi:hypothetical protein
VKAQENRNSKKVSFFIGLVVIFLLVSQALGAEVSQEWKQVVSDYYSGMPNPEGPSWKSWEEGLKKSHSFYLKRLEVSVEFLNQEDLNSEGVSIGIILTVKAYCLDSANTKKKVISVRAVVVVISKDSKEVVGGTTVLRLPMVVSPGWDLLNDV